MSTMTTSGPATGPTTGPTTGERVERLNRVSTARIIEPDEHLPGRLGEGQLLPDELLSVAGLDLDLSAEQRITLSREEVASITENGIRFEAILTAGFALEIAQARRLTDPRVTYLLHEIGEETRHSRLFVRMLDQIQPEAVDPLARGPLLALVNLGSRLIISLPALLYTLVLAGEEIPDLLQKLAGEHPDSDPFVRDVNRYHRQEEARHLAFARLRLPEVWARSSLVERLAVRLVAPGVIRGMFDTLVHPGVYRTVGLPGWKTWRAANASAKRSSVRHQATRPVLQALLDAGSLRPGRVPRGWQRLCGVDAHGQPL